MGHDVMNELASRSIEGIGSDIAAQYCGRDDGSPVTTMPYVRLDITDRQAVSQVLGQIMPDAVIHCAAWTAVDAAQKPDNIAMVHSVNAGGTENIALTCRELGCKMMYISTDYVFDGRGTEPWQPDCRDFSPLSEYGKSKLEGEFAVSRSLEKYFIVRISWAFGLGGKNFIETMLGLSKKHDTISVVNDQIGTPTYTLDLARLLVDMILSEKYGYYHASNEGGFISWYDFACEIFRHRGLTTKVIPVTTAQYGSNGAARPLNSRLDKSKLAESGFEPLPAWQDALARYFKETEA